jgi:hypothetical protein
MQAMACSIAQALLATPYRGWVAEWLNALVLKTSGRESVSGVRIPPHPPFSFVFIMYFCATAHCYHKRSQKQILCKLANAALLVMQLPFSS